MLSYNKGGSMEENTINRNIHNNINSTNVATKSINPWLTIWYRPSQSFKWFINNKPEHMIIPLVLIGGFQRYLIRAYDKSIGDVVSLPIVLLLAITLGSLFLGLLGLYVGSHILKSTGKWIGGQGTLDEIKAAYAWSYVPEIWSLILWMIVLTIWGPDIFKSQSPSIYADVLMLATALINFWSTITFVICLREVQKFSILKAILNTVLSFLVIFILLTCLLCLHPLTKFL
jgi:hypothetical protein